MSRSGGLTVGLFLYVLSAVEIRVSVSTCCAAVSGLR